VCSVYTSRVFSAPCTIDATGNCGGFFFYERDAMGSTRHHHHHHQGPIQGEHPIDVLVCKCCGLTDISAYSERPRAKLQAKLTVKSTRKCLASRPCPPTQATSGSDHDHHHHHRNHRHHHYNHRQSINQWYDVNTRLSTLSSVFIAPCSKTPCSVMKHLKQPFCSAGILLVARCILPSAVKVLAAMSCPARELRYVK